MQLALDEKDKIILKTIHKNQPIRHFELRKIIVKDMDLMAGGTFERRIKNLIKTNALRYVIVEKMKFYSFNYSVPIEARKLLMMKTGIKSADENITRMKKLIHKLPLNEKAELAASCVLSVLANIFDVLKYNVDHNPKVITKWRLLVQYQQKLREMYDIIREDPDHEIIEFFVDAKCRPNLNELSDDEFDRFLDMRYISSKIFKSKK